MNFAELIFNIPMNERKIIRKIEKIEKKIIDNKYALVFNQTCIKENILPIYTNIKIHDLAVRQLKITQDYRRI